MHSQGTLRLATRTSTLAREQAGLVAEALEDRRYEVDLALVETTGDQLRDELIHDLGTTGAFVRELDERVLDDESDVEAAVHSMKDVPTEQPRELVTAAVPERSRPADVLVTPDGTSLDDLPEESVVGTSSLRRRAQILGERPDLVVEPLRGNVDTRIEKLLAPTLQEEYDERREARETEDGYKPSYEGQDPNGELDLDDWLDELAPIERAALDRDVETRYDAIVLAEAGIVRSGLSRQIEYQRLATTQFPPAPGQGTLAVTARDGETARELRDAIDHARTRAETTVERTLLAELGGGCIAPIGIYAVVQGSYVHTTVGVYDHSGETSVTATRDLPVDSHVEAAREFAADLTKRGAADLIAAARDGSSGGDGDSGRGPAEERDSNASESDSEEREDSAGAADPSGEGA